ncbi:unnamed protein product [Symbiodinium sp. CCMP2456]|nr:unnamed protein product [Symbiodinium sp. CCMP2456]
MAVLSLVLLVTWLLGSALSHRLQDTVRVPGVVEGEAISAEQIQGELQQELPEAGSSLADALARYPIFRPPTERSALFLRGALNARTDNTTCQHQLGGLLRALIAACHEKTRVGYDYEHKQLFGPSGLKPKTCQESAKDIFLHGEELVGTYRVPPELVAHGKVPEATLPLVQSLDFLKSWLIPLATAKKDALIWAGFWTDPHDPHGRQRRSSVEMLAEFAQRTEHDTVHPDTVLGALIEKHGALGRCSDTMEHHLIENLWKLASFAFVSGMREKGQNTVIALVNKELEGERSLQKSVLYKYEVPTLGLAAWGMGYWSPKVLLIDLKGSCARTSPALRRQMFGGLKPWYLDRRKDHWSAQEFAAKSRVTWQCWNCPKSSCNLDHQLAARVKTLREAQKKKIARDDDMMKAAWLGKEAVVRRLLKQKADIRYQEPVAGQTALHYAAKHGGASMVSLLLMKKADIHVKDQAGKTPLHVAVEDFAVGRGHDRAATDMVHMLLKGRADVNARNDEGQTALQVAREMRVDSLDPTVVRMLKTWEDDLPQHPSE